MNPSVKAIFFFFLFAVVGYFSVYPQSASIKINLGVSGVLSVLGGLFFLVLLIERTTEIAIALWRQPEENIKKAELSTLEADPAKAMDTATKKTELASFQAETKGAALTPLQLASPFR